MDPRAIKHARIPIPVAGPGRFGPLPLAVAVLLAAPLPRALAVCTPGGPYNNAANTVVCAPGTGEAIDTLGGSDTVTVNSGTVTSVAMGTGNDTFILTGGTITAPGISVDQGSGDDLAQITGGIVTGTLLQGGNADTYIHSGGGSVGTVDQGTGNDIASVGIGAVIGSFIQGSGTDTLGITGGSITLVDQGSFADILTMSGGSVGSIDQGTGDDRFDLSGGIIAGAVAQGDGQDVLIMSGGQMASLTQGGGLDRAFISGGVITGLFFAGDDVELAGGSIGELNLEAGDNRLAMWGTAQIAGNVNSESGIDTYELFGGAIGGNITTGSANDILTIGGTPASFNGTPIAGVFGATDIAGSVVMEGGNDRLIMTGGSIGGSIFMDAGLGNTNALAGDGFDDTVELRGGTVAGDVNTDADAQNQIGRDEVTLDGTQVTGAIDVGGGSDQIYLNSGSAGSVNGGNGDDLIAWNSPAAFVGAPAVNNGAIVGGLGSDIVAINVPGIDLSQMTLDGGDDVSAADGQVDVLALNGGWSGALSGARTTNFEVLYVGGGTIRFSDGAVTVGSDAATDPGLSALAGFPVPYGIVVDQGGTLDATNDLAVTGNLTLRSGTMLAGRSGGNTASVSGRLSDPAGSTIDLTSGGAGAGDRLRVGGNYEGGGTIRLDAALDASRASDVVVIAGTVVSGVTALRVRDVGDGTGSGTGSGAGRGIALVDVSASGGTTAGQFVLAGGPLTVNAFTYVLNLETDGVWYLQSALRPIVPAAASVPHVLDDIGLTMVGTYHERMGDALVQSDASASGQRGAWARVVGQRTEETLAMSELGGLETSTTMTGVQGGFDLMRWQGEDRSLTSFGVSGGFAEAWADTRSGRVAGATDFTGGLAGLHLTHTNAAGWYADGGLYGAWFGIDAEAGSDRFETSSQSFIANLEVGQAVATGIGGLLIEPQAQMIYQYKAIDGASDGSTSWDFDVEPALLARAGFRLTNSPWEVGGNGHAVTGYLKANVWHSLSGGEHRIEIGTLPVDFAGRETWADAGLGFSVRAGDQMVIFADGDVAFDLDGGDLWSMTGKAGFRINW